MDAEQKGIVDTSQSPHVKLRSIGIADCEWTDGFWGQRFEQCKEVMVPNVWRILESDEISHAYANFKIAAGVEEGAFCGRYWHDGDFYKGLEAICYVYAHTRDPKWEAILDEAIGVVARAQRDDGYLHTPTLIGHGFPTGEKQDLGRKFEGLSEPYQDINHHEMYNAGHLMTAACIHHRVTGKDSLLKVATKYADFIYEVYRSRPTDIANFCFNPSQVMGLVELYRETGDQRYVELARIFLEIRGTGPGGSDHTQTRTPFFEETEAIGHAVTGNYLWAGAADIYAETNDDAILEKLLDFWDQVAHSKMAITGGVGKGLAASSQRDVMAEAYADPYELPNVDVYYETCGNLSHAMWNWRLLGITGESKHVDVMERVLYNSALSAIGLDGVTYFYTNPLRYIDGHPYTSRDGNRRQDYIAVFCCPPNIVRTIAKSGGWAYSVNEGGVYVNLYGGNLLDTKLPGGEAIRLKQRTEYPWKGAVRIEVEKAPDRPIDLALRIPDWAEHASVQVNGKVIDDKVGGGRYYSVSRNWRKGDVIELELLMEARLIEAHPYAEEVANHVAVQRGPVVYCLESPDLPNDVKVTEILIPADVELTAEYDEDRLGGVVVLKGEALYQEGQEWKDALYQPLNEKPAKPIGITLVPYYAWANREPSEMTVWMPLAR